MRRWALIGLTTVVWRVGAGYGSPVVAPPAGGAEATASVWGAEAAAPSVPVASGQEAAGSAFLPALEVFLPGYRAQIENLAAAVGPAANELAAYLQTNAALSTQVGDDKELLVKPRRLPKPPPPPPAVPQTERWNPFQYISGAGWFNLVFAIVIVLVLLLKGR